MRGSQCIHPMPARKRLLTIMLSRKLAQKQAPSLDSRQNSSPPPVSSRNVLLRDYCTTSSICRNHSPVTEHYRCAPHHFPEGCMHAVCENKIKPCPISVKHMEDARFNRFDSTISVTTWSEDSNRMRFNLVFSTPYVHSCIHSIFFKQCPKKTAPTPGNALHEPLNKFSCYLLETFSGFCFLWTIKI